VLVQFPNVSQLMEKVGVKLEEIKSSPLKAAPNGFEPTSPEAFAAMASIVNDTYGWFKGLVQERRSLDAKDLATVTDGRIFTGQQALDLKLIDGLGDDQDAIAWLESARSVPKDLPVRDWEKPSESSSFGLARSLAAAVAGSLGAGSLAAALGVAPGSDAGLDGLVSVWHPQVQN
jgi:protease IV